MLNPEIKRQPSRPHNPQLAMPDRYTPMSADFSTNPMQKSRFECAVATTFEIAPFPADESGAPIIRVTLEEVSARSAPKGYEQFAALFRGPAGPLLPQGTYHFRHAKLGEFPLFMVPVGRDMAGTLYEVCVSRKLSP